MPNSLKIQTILLADQVTKTYLLGKQKVDALKGVTLKVAAGEFLAIAGSSGSGKTTLLNLMGCLDRPTTGSVTVDGLATATLGRTEISQLRAKKIGFVFQSFNLLPALSATENVEYPLLLLGYSRAERVRLAAEALERVGLENFGSHRPASLSGGQQQRVAIARAIVKKPAVIFADEPTASLDKKNALGVLSLMRELNREHGTTFVFSSHDPLVLGQAERVFLMSDGLAIDEYQTELRRVA